MNNGRYLFVGSDSSSDVVLNWFGNPKEHFEFYAKAYHTAARTLFLRSTQEELRDHGACPVVFLYRHSLELYLKEILISGQRILELSGKPFSSVDEILKRHGKHCLCLLWGDLVKLHKQMDWEWDAELHALGKIIGQFNNLDPRSFGFRYPVSKKGVNNVKANFRFDLKHFCDRMDELIAKLENTSCGVAGVADQMSR